MNDTQHITKEEYFKLSSKKSKLHNKIGEFNGRQFHSKLEAQVVKVYDAAFKSGKYKEMSLQVPFSIRVKGVNICKYIADIVIVHKDNTVEVIDAKGMETDVFKLKWKLMQACHPDLKYRLIKNV